MPPLEAAYLNCPVIASDLNGHRKILGDYATYFDPKDEDKLTALMLDSVNNVKSSGTFKQKKFSIEHSMESLNAIFMQSIIIRKNWA